MESFRRVGQLIDDIGHARFEEGSEHFFAYALEQVSGRSFMHGEAVSLGTVIMSELQGNDPATVRLIVDEAGVRFRPGQLGLTWDEVVSTLGRLGSYVREQELWFSVANDVGIDEETLARLRAILDG
jgi:glycerol-1-phosphate dehydrogenase [NAD(P)+]